MFSPLHSATNEEQIGEAPLQSIKSPRKIRTIRAPSINYCLESGHYASLSAMFRPLHSDTSEE